MITPIPPSHEVDPGAPDKVPQSVRDEEAFLDALVDRDDTDESDLEELHHKVAEAYTDEGRVQNEFIRSVETKEGVEVRSTDHTDEGRVQNEFIRSVETKEGVEVRSTEHDSEVRSTEHDDEDDEPTGDGTESSDAGSSMLRRSRGSGKGKTQEN